MLETISYTHDGKQAFFYGVGDPETGDACVTNQQQKNKIKQITSAVYNKLRRRV